MYIIIWVDAFPVGVWNLCTPSNVVSGDFNLRLETCMTSTIKLNLLSRQCYLFLWLQFRFTFTLIGDKQTSRLPPIVVRSLWCLFPLAQYRNKYLLVTNLEAVFYSTLATLLPYWSLLVHKMDQLKPKHTSSISLYLNDYLSLRSPSNTHHH